MTDHVDELLKLWRQSDFKWGDTDCMLSIGDYAASRGAVDVTPDYRGQYSTQEAARARIERDGGSHAIIERSGLPRTSEPKRGDIVLVDIAGGIGGVHTGQGVAVRRERGTAEINLKFVRILAAWSFPE